MPETKKILYIHIPKTAGSSIIKAPFIEQGTYQHKPISWHIKGSKYTPLEKVEDYFKFTFVRNPFERFASGVINHKYATPETFNDFVSGKFLEYPKHWKSWEWVHLIPMYLFTHYEGKNQMDFIGRFEKLEDDFAELKNIISKKVSTATEAEIIKTFKLPHENKGALKQDYMKLYNSKSKKIVREVYEIDFAEFNYE